MGAILGANCKLYRNTGTYDTPVWDEVPIVKDLTLNLEAGQADTTTRAAAGWETSIAGLKKGGIDFQVVWEPSNQDFEAFRAAFFNNSLIDLAVMDGNIATNGSSGLRAEMAVLSFSRSEQLKEAVTAAIKAAPGFSAHAPAWMIVGDETEGGATTTTAPTTTA